MSSDRSNSTLLARVNFPLYSVEMLTSRHVVVAGGGGSSKTGVANGFQIYEIYHNGQGFVAEEIVRHETGANVVMNCAVRSSGGRSYLVAGQESHCQLYHVNFKIDGMVNGNLNEERQILFKIKSGDLIQTDFSTNSPLQRVVRISLNCKYMATGGTDAHVRIWKFPSMVQLFDIDAHSREIDDLDFSPDSKQLVSIAKDGFALIWNVESGKECAKLNWRPPNNVKYLFKRCRFGIYEERVDQHRLFTIANPLGKFGKQVGYLQEWCPENGSLVNSVALDESLASLAIRDDGRFVAIGTMFSGSVSIYIAFSLQRVLYIPNAHSMFITGLEFLPQNNVDGGEAITSNSEAAVLSISVDNKICIHSLLYRHTIPAWFAILLIIGALFVTFSLCSYIGL